MAKKVNKTQLLEDLKNFKIENIDKKSIKEKVVYTIILGEAMPKKEEKLDLILSEIKEIKLDIIELKSDVAILKQDMIKVKSDVNELKIDVKQLKSEAIKHGWDIK